MPSSAFFGIWPGAITLYVQVRARPVKGTGDYSNIQSAWPGCDASGLTIISTDGALRPMPWRDLVVAIHQHLANSNLFSYWSAPIGSSSEELQRVLGEFDPSSLVGATKTLCVWFDGPNGPVSFSLG